MMNRARVWIVLIVTALLLTGCLGTKTLPVPNPPEPTLFVDYQRSGGIAGVNDRLVVFDNGVALVSSRITSREIQLNQSELEQISHVFEAARFTALEGNYTSPRGGADFMQYSISYKGKTINTEDTAIPPAMEPVIEAMNRIMSNGMSRGQTDLSLPGFGL
jgi:hypothetical protein